MDRWRDAGCRITLYILLQTHNPLTTTPQPRNYYPGTPRAFPPKKYALPMLPTSCTPPPPRHAPHIHIASKLPLGSCRGTVCPASPSEPRSRVSRRLQARCACLEDPHLSISARRNAEDGLGIFDRFVRCYKARLAYGSGLGAPLCVKRPPLWLPYYVLHKAGGSISICKLG